MCGIAGYNASEEFAEKHLTAAKQETILQEAWLHNLHRGYEAAGFMGWANDKLVHWKRQGSAADLLLKTTKKDRIPDLEPMRVFGAHTRQSTLGDPKFNINNHPVNVGRVWVTHNGSISNHYQIKTNYDLTVQPVVDSAIIAAMLDLVDDPRDFRQVAAALAPLNGNIAFHAIFRDYPGLSVFCRGSGSPFIMAYHKSGCLVYGSTVPAVYATIAAMGLKADSPGWNYQQLDTNKIIIMENGQPIGFGMLPFRAVGVNANHSKAPFTVTRVLPPKADSFHDGDPMAVYSTDLNNDWPVRVGKMGRDVNFMVENQELETVFTENDGILKDTLKYGTDGPLTPVIEADDVIYDKKAYVYHAYFGDVEILMGPDRKILDVYDHSKFNTEDRWVVEDKENTEKFGRDNKLVIVDNCQFEGTWEEFYKQKTTALPKMTAWGGTIPNKMPRYQYAVDWDDALAKLKKEKEEEKEKKDKQNSPFLGQYSKHSKDSTPSRTTNSTVGDIVNVNSKRREKPYSEESDDNDFEESKKMQQAIIVDWDLFPYLVWNAKGKDSGMGFVSNGRCPDHDVTFEEHDDPDRCTVTQFASLYALYCAADLDIAHCMLSTLALDLDFVAGGQCDDNKHEWYPAATRVVRWGKSEFDLVTAEDCYHCGMYRYLTSWPEWSEKFMTAERSIIGKC